MTVGILRPLKTPKNAYTFFVVASHTVNRVVMAAVRAASGSRRLLYLSVNRDNV